MLLRIIYWILTGFFVFLCFPWVLTGFWGGLVSIVFLILFVCSVYHLASKYKYGYISWFSSSNLVLLLFCVLSLGITGGIVSIFDTHIKHFGSKYISYLTIFFENRPGILWEVCSIFAFFIYSLGFTIEALENNSISSTNNSVAFFFFVSISFLFLVIYIVFPDALFIYHLHFVLLLISLVVLIYADLEYLSELGLIDATKVEEMVYYGDTPLFFGNFCYLDNILYMALQ